MSGVGAHRWWRGGGEVVDAGGPGVVDGTAAAAAVMTTHTIHLHNEITERVFLLYTINCC